MNSIKSPPQILHEIPDQQPEHVCPFAGSSIQVEINADTNDYAEGALIWSFNQLIPVKIEKINNKNNTAIVKYYDLQTKAEVTETVQSNSLRINSASVEGESCLPAVGDPIYIDDCMFELKQDKNYLEELKIFAQRYSKLKNTILTQEFAGNCSNYFTYFPDCYAQRPDISAV